MLTIFNRRELMVVLSTDQLFQVKNALAEAGIPCHAVALNRGGASHGRGRSAFVNQDYLCQYRVHVHRDDYDRAMAAVQAAR